MGDVTVTTPLSGLTYHPEAGTCCRQPITNFESLSPPVAKAMQKVEHGAVWISYLGGHSRLTFVSFVLAVSMSGSVVLRYTSNTGYTLYI